MKTGFIIAIVVAIAAAFVYILARQNSKDEKKLEHDLNEDYPHPKDEGEKA